MIAICVPVSKTIYFSLKKQLIRIGKTVFFILFKLRLNPFAKVLCARVDGWNALIGASASERPAYDANLIVRKTAIILRKRQLQRTTRVAVAGAFTLKPSSTNVHFIELNIPNTESTEDLLA